MQPLPLSLAQLVADVTTDFIKETKFRVEDSAQFALLTQGKTGEADLLVRVAGGKVSIEELKAGLKKLLARARVAAEHCQAPGINAGQVRDAMREECTVKPWC